MCCRCRRDTPSATRGWRRSSPSVMTSLRGAGRRSSGRAVSDQLRTVPRVPARRDRFLRVAAADGDVRHGSAGGFGRRRVHVRPRAGAVRRRDAAGRFPMRVDPVAIASLSDNIPDGWRAVGPYQAELAGASTTSIVAFWWSGGCRSGCTRRRSVWPYGAQVDDVDTDEQRLTMAEKLGARVHDRPKPDKSWDPFPVTVHTSADPSVLSATLRATWPDGVCTDSGHLLLGRGGDAAVVDVHPRCAVRDRAGQCAGGDPGDPRIAYCDL